MRPVDPETELPTIPGDPVSREIRDEELLNQTLGGSLARLKIVWQWAMCENWGGDKEK